MDLAVSHVRKVCYLELRKIAHLRPVLSEETTTRLVISFVLSRLDYSNSLFCSITLENIKINGSHAINQSSNDLWRSRDVSIFPFNDVAIDMVYDTYLMSLLI